MGICERNVEKYGKCLKYVSEELQDDREIVELALKTYPDAIHCMSDRLRNETEFISKLIGQRGFEELPDDREIVLKSIKINERNMERGSMELQNDREFILQAIKNNGFVIGYVKEEFKSDREIVMEAVKQNGTGFEYMNEEFQSDIEIIAAALTHKLFDKQVIITGFHDCFDWPDIFL